MSDSEASLSAEDFKQKLYHSLRRKGVVDSLKSQLREKLVSELHHSSLSSSIQRSTPPSKSKDETLLQRAANSLVADHLKKCRYDYSLSVFVPESGTSQDQMFTVRDLLQLLKISPHSKLYKTLALNIPAYDQKGFLWQLLCELALYHSRSTHDIEVQTELRTTDPRLAIDAKLQEVDEEYEGKKYAHHKNQSAASEERLMAYQRELEERSRLEIKSQVDRFKENQLLAMRIEEREKGQKEIDRMRKEFEQTYQLKSEALLERERHGIESLQTQQQIQEKELFESRQSLLLDIEKVREREAVLKREAETQKREKILQEEKLKNYEDLIKKREHEVRRMEDELETRIQTDVSRYKIEEQGRLLQRTKDLEVQEARVTDEAKRLSEEREALKNMQEELRVKSARVSEMESQLQGLQHDLVSTSKNNEVMKEKIREMVDYRSVKEDNAVLRKELENTKMRLAEVTNECERQKLKQEELLKGMAERSSRPSPELLLLQQELQKARDQVKQGQAVFEHMKSQMEARIQDEGDKNQEFMKHFEEQTLQQKEMNREIMDLRQQLLNTQQALNNEVYRKPKVSGFTGRPLSRNAVGFEDTPVPDRGTTHDLYYDTSLGRSNIDRELLLAGDGGYGNMSVGLTTDIDALLARADRELRESGVERDVIGASAMRPRSRSPDNSSTTDIVEDTKRRLKNLEKEAENFEATYRNFQHRLANPHLPAPEPVRVTENYRVTFTDDVEARTLRYGYTSPLPTSPLRSQPHSLSRPLSSTPFKQMRRTDNKQDERSYSPPTQDGVHRVDQLPSFAVSDVTQIVSPPQLQSRDPKHQLSVGDLEARPGSPSVVVLPGSEEPSQASDQDKQTRLQHEQAREEEYRQEQEKEQHEKEMRERERQELEERERRLHDEREKQEQEVRDRARNEQEKLEQERQKQKEQEEREKLEREDREWEENRRRREEERKRKQQEAFEREQRELEEMKKTSEQGKAEAVPEADDKTEAPSGDVEQIDPVMQKYMAMIQQKKQQEKQIAQHAVGIWSKGHQISQDKSPDISAASPEPEDVKQYAEESDGDFSW